MKQEFYAAYNSFNDEVGWSIHIFYTEKERDRYVSADKLPNGEQQRYKVNFEQAQQIEPCEWLWLYPPTND